MTLLQKLKIVKNDKSMESSDPRDFIFNTEFESVIVYMTALREVVVPASSEVKDTVNFKDINMDQDYTFDFYPIVKLSVELEPGSGIFHSSPFTITSDDGFSVNIVQDDKTDTGVQKDKFFVTFKNNTGSQITVKYRYRVFANIG